MTIKYIFNSVTLQNEDIQEQFPGLISAIQSYLPAQKTPKKRKPRKKKVYMSDLIKPIIDSIEE